MSSSENRAVSIPVVVGIYLAAVAGLLVLAGIFSAVVFDLKPEVVGPASMVSAAAVAANYWVWREKAVPASRRRWIAALSCGVASTILSVGLLAVGLLLENQLLGDFHDMWSGFGGGAIAAAALIGILALTVAIQTVIIGVVFGSASRRLAKSFGIVDREKNIRKVF